jgi:CHAT domain-containing protein
MKRAGSPTRDPTSKPRGEFVDAAEAARKSGDNRQATTSLINAAACLKMSGDIKAAEILIRQAEARLPADSPALLRMQVMAQKGSILSLGDDPTSAIPILRESLANAEKHGERLIAADIANDLGTAWGARQGHAEAMTWFAKAGQEARAGGDPALATRARQNHLVAAFQLWNESRIRYSNSVDAGVRLGPVAETLERHRRAFLASLSASRRRIGPSPKTPLEIFHALTAGMAAQRFGLNEEAFSLLSIGLDAARRAGDPQLELAGLLAFAEAYVARAQFEDGLTVLDQARALPGQPDPSQLARLEILTAECIKGSPENRQQTVEALERAIQHLEAIRSDLALSQETTDLGRPFRERTGRPYLLLAGQFLRQAERGGSDQNELYQKSRDLIENFKAWELEDFFRDDCVNLAMQNTVDLTRLAAADVATLYAIPLDDRVELLLGLGGTDRIHRRVSPLPSQELARLARRLRHDLESDFGSPAAYFEESEALFDALIRPLLDTLRENKIRHLVFVPDGALATIPLSALFDHDSERYLIEDFSISIAPSLSLVAGEPVDTTSSFCLLAGTSKAVSGFPALPEVKQELADIAALYPKHLLRLDSQFTAASLAEDLSGSINPLEATACIVHLACHGEFKGRSRDTFLAAADGRIFLDDLEKAIRPRKYHGQPVELLCLSACRTAAGDDRAALGLAGAAVKSGARGVVASLWYVESASTADLMTDFHQRLQSRRCTKAEALRQAQLGFLRRDPNTHPRLWAPFILIGDWR